MKRLFGLFVLIGLCENLPAIAADGLVSQLSPHSVTQTMNRVEDLAKQRAMIIFARIDHAAGAAQINQTLRPTQLLIFGHPKGGTPMMQCAQTSAIDLPLKALVWEDEQGRVWLGYNDPLYLAQRHGAAQCPAVENLRKALAGLAESALKP